MGVQMSPHTHVKSHAWNESSQAGERIVAEASEHVIQLLRAQQQPLIM